LADTVYETVVHAELQGDTFFIDEVFVKINGRHLITAQYYRDHTQGRCVCRMGKGGCLNVDTGFL